MLMRKVTTLLLLFGAMATSMAWAQNVDLAAVDMQKGGQELDPAAVQVSGDAQQATVVKNAVLKPGAITRHPARKATRKRAVASVTDLAGKGVMTYGSLISTNGAGGSSTEISPVGNDSILISNFWLGGVNVKAGVNLTQKTISIPSQYAYTHNTYGEMDLATVTSAAEPDYDTPITGTIDDNGTITLDGMWAIFVKSGKNAGNIVYAGYDTEIEKANGQMRVKYINDASDTTYYDWNVVVAQTGKNLVTVKNFGNHGKTIEVVLKSDSTLSIDQQLVFEGGSTMGNFYTLPADWSTGKTTGSTIVGKVNGNQLTWGNWIMLSTNKYYTGKLLDGTVTANFDFAIPQLVVTEWQGEGTEANPWKIKTLDDLVLLADKVNNDPDQTYGGPYTFHTKSFNGKYFRVENDIDMSGYRFTPIGNAWTQRFSGTFDGNGHTRTGLNVNTGVKGYAGLFGCADTASVIKNLTLKNVKVSSMYYYTAGVVGYQDHGNIENCHVTGTITSEGIGSGGIVALGNNVKNSTFEGTIASTGGINGGIAGETYGHIDNCWAKGTVKAAGPTDTYTAGGIVGTAYNADAKVTNCYFTGTVDGSTHSNLYLGGVVGQVYKGTVDGCFAVANVYGFDSKSGVGGVVGVLQGTVLNSYATGHVRSASSRQCGGITGLLKPYVNSTAQGNDTVQSTVKNCYYTGRLNAETYQYVSETEVRETLGTIEAGSSPTVENVYFDQQMVDLKSQHYRVLTSDLTSANGPKGFPADKWTFTQNFYPRLKGLDDNAVAQQGASVLKLDNDFPDNVNYVANNATFYLLGNSVAKVYEGEKLSDKGANVTIEGTTLKLNGTFGTDTLVIYNPNDMAITPRLFVLKVAPRFFEGTGKEESPFLIKNKADLIKLSELTTKVGQYYPGVYFLQTADIDLEKDTAFVGICNQITNYTYSRFAGTYDGGGHAIHNMKLEYVQWKDHPQGEPETGNGTKSCIYKGFIGQTDAMGVVKNLTLAADCQIELWGFAGGFVGYNWGTVDNCRNYATIYGYSGTVGGIVGSNCKGAVVKNSLNAGNVYTGFTTVGGISGTNGGTIENCENVGNVEAKVLSDFVRESRIHIAGGISGSSSGGVFRNVVNAGLVSAPRNVGGIVGSISGTIKSDGCNDIYQGLNYGTILTQDLTTTGNIGGNGYASIGTYEHCYYDKQATGLQAAANDGMPGAEAVPTATLTSGKALAGYADSLWLFSKGRYPMLKSFANDAVAVEAAQVVLTAADGETVKQMQHNATLSNVQGTTWKLAQGKAFAIDGTTLKVPATSSLVGDTLTATLGGFTRPYLLQAVSPVPLAGSGTQADPYQIHSAGEWNAFAQYMAATTNPFEGQYVKIMNDIDFGDTTFVAIAYDGVTSFNGTLDGARHTVKGIKYAPKASYQGAIALIGAKATVNDLTLEGTVTSAKTYTGGFSGKMKGVLNNCVNNVAVTTTAASTGGFAAYAYKNAVFNNCENKAAVSSSKDAVAGFAANAEDDVYFNNSVNSGKVAYTGTSTSARNVAGFVAVGNGSHYYACLNKGEIAAGKAAQVAGIQAYSNSASTVYFVSTGNEGALSGASSVAGLIGYTSKNKAPLYIDSCYNVADINTTLKTTYATAGLVGCLTPGSRVMNSYNTGTITADASIYNGNIFGYSEDAKSEAERSYVTNCYNTGGIIATNYAAGIGGRIPAYCTIDSCYNTGEITATFGASGIGNIMGNYVVIQNSWNSGNCQTSKQGAGGINGYGNYIAHVVNCFNTGNIGSYAAGSYNVGGLGGQSMATYINCYNRGVVNGTKGVGGLVGQSSRGNATRLGTSFYNCYNAGRVIAGDTTSGNIVGTVTPANWDSTNVVENTYYVTDFGTFAQDTIQATPISVKQLAALTEFAPSPTAVATSGVDAAAGWDALDEFSFPVIPGFTSNDCARAYAAAVVLTNDNDTYGGVASTMMLGTPDGVTWTSSNDALTITGNEAVHKAGAQGVVLTATCGQFSAPWTVDLLEGTGVTDVHNANQIVKTVYYNVAGIEIPASNVESGQVYIEVNTYSDGTTRSTKVRK